MFDIARNLERDKQTAAEKDKIGRKGIFAACVQLMLHYTHLCNETCTRNEFKLPCVVRQSFEEEYLFAFVRERIEDRL